LSSSPSIQGAKKGCARSRALFIEAVTSILRTAAATIAGARGYSRRRRRRVHASLPEMVAIAVAAAAAVAVATTAAAFFPGQTPSFSSFTQPFSRSAAA